MFREALTDEPTQNYLHSVQVTVLLTSMDIISKEPQEKNGFFSRYLTLLNSNSLSCTHSFVSKSIMQKIGLIPSNFATARFNSYLKKVILKSLLTLKHNGLRLEVLCRI